MTREKDIEKAVCDYAREHGILVRKYVSPSAKGVPDRIFWLPGGRPLLVEFKAPSGRISPRQYDEIVRMRKLGYRTLIIDNVQDGIHAINQYGKIETSELSAQTR